MNDKAILHATYITVVHWASFSVQHSHSLAIEHRSTGVQPGNSNMLIMSNVNECRLLKRDQCFPSDPPTIHYLYLLPAHIGLQMEYTLHRSPVYHRAYTCRQTTIPTSIHFTLRGNIESPIHLTCMSLNCGKKIRTEQNPHRRGDSDNHCTTVPPPQIFYLSIIDQTYACDHFA